MSGAGLQGGELGHRAMQAPAAGSSPLETGPKTIRAGFFLHERGNPVRQMDDGITGFLDGRNTGFLTYHGFLTIASLSRIISRDYYYYYYYYYLYIDICYTMYTCM
jgi:hypothetical protein